MNLLSVVSSVLLKSLVLTAKISNQVLLSYQISDRFKQLDIKITEKHHSKSACSDRAAGMHLVPKYKPKSFQQQPYTLARLSIPSRGKTLTVEYKEKKQEKRMVILYTSWRFMYFAALMLVQKVTVENRFPGGLILITNQLSHYKLIWASNKNC